MPTVAIVSQKGGSGKTTLALNLATYAAYRGTQACVIDTDPQATAAAWGDWRGDFLPEVITSPPIRLPRMIRNATNSGTELILIDTPPQGDTATHEAVRNADIVLIPARPRAFDLHAIEATAEMISYSLKPAFVVLNAVPAGATRILADAHEFIESLGLRSCPVHFGDRGAFHRSSAKGETASEAEPEGKAAGEVKALWEWLCREIDIGAID